MDIKIKNRDGVKILTASKYCDEDINILLDHNLFPSGNLDITENGEYNVTDYETVKVEVESSSGGDSVDKSDSVAYYKSTRDKNYPYFPLPSEMDGYEDTIYMLYDASEYMCCPVFNITYTNCVVTVKKYNNTELVSESILNDVQSGTTYYMQFSEEDSDYSTYNYIVIKMQGNITKYDIRYSPKFNGVYYDTASSNELIEVSGRCLDCIAYGASSSYSNLCKKLKYYSFLGSSIQSLSNAFKNCFSLTIIPELDTSKVTDMSSMFYSCYSLTTIPELDTSNVTDMSSMFNICQSLTTIPYLDTKNVTNMQSMFNSCDSLITIPELDTSNVTDMSSMFNTCYSLTKIPELDTSSATNMSYMFAYCYSLKTILGLDTKNATNMNNMFYSCYSLSTMPLLDTSSATNMSYMFAYCYSLKTIPEVDTSSATNINNMFYYCTPLVKCNIKNIKLSFSLNNSTMLSQNELVNILNNLLPVETTQTLTLGSKLLNKLTDEQKQIATNKGWTLA